MSKLESSSQVAQQAEIGLGEESLMEGGMGNVEENGFISSLPCHLYPFYLLIYKHL